jgi:outer membrane protein assembly factor BamB
MQEVQLPPNAPEDSTPVRWWPGLALIVLAATAILILWTPDIPNRDVSIFWTMLTLSLTPILILVWLLFFSRLSLRNRLTASGMFLLLFGMAFFFIRISGVSGDFVPSLEWRHADDQAADMIQTTGATEDQRLDRETADYPQFLGPNRNATLAGIQLDTDWQANPPRLLWRQPIGKGWSAFAVVGHSAITQEQQGDEEQTVCYNLKTGEVKWRHGDKAKFVTTTAGDGPRGTPVISGERVYTYGATGILNCLDLRTGELVWTRRTLEENGARNKDWGMAGSPLIIDQKVIVSPGGPNGKSLVAYHKDTGDFVWGGGDARAGYSSPSLTKLAGIEQILIFNMGQVSSHAPGTGEVLWQHPWSNGFSVQHVAQPVPLPSDRVFVSTGYGVGCELLQINADEDSAVNVSVVWKSPRLQAKFTNVVHRNGYIYGLDNGRLVCLDLQDGQRKWKRGRYGHGQMILVDDILLIQAESGEVVLVDADPKGFNERAKFQAIEGKTWNNPALAGKYLLVRNDREAACYEVTIIGKERSISGVRSPGQEANGGE